MIFSRTRLRLLIAPALLMLCHAQAGEDTAPAYPLGMPPLLAIRADSVATLSRVAEAPHVRQAVIFGGRRAWSELDGVGQLDVDRLFAVLAAQQARALALYLLPPTPPPHEVILAVEMPHPPASAGEQMEFLAQCGVSDASAGAEETTNGIRLFRRPSSGSTLAILARQKHFYIASNPAHLVPFTHPFRRDPYGRDTDWRASLESLPLQRCVSLWIDLPRALSALEHVRALGSGRDWLARFGDRMQQRGLAIPEAITLIAHPFANPMQTDIAIPLPVAPGWTDTARAPSVSPANAFPSAVRLRLCLNQDARDDDGQPRDIACGLPRWKALLSAADVVDYEQAFMLESATHAFRLLTGLHPGVDLLERMDRQAAFASWQQPSGEDAWCAVLPLLPDASASMRETLRRAESWARYYALRAGDDFAARPFSEDGEEWGRVVEWPDEGIRCAVLLTGSALFIASEESVARESARRMAANHSIPAPGGWLSWQIAYDTASRTRLARTIRQSIMKPPPAQAASDALADQMAWQGKKLAWDAMLTNIMAFLDEESGILGPAGAAVRLRLRGNAAPSALAAGLGIDIIPGVSGTAGHATAHATRAAGFLRTVLEMQQAYRFLRLAAVNNRDAGYAPTLSALVGDRAENGAPLTAFWDKLYPRRSEEEYPLSIILQAIGDGMAAYGYVFRSPQTRGKNPVDYRTEWALAAIPNRPRTDPALWIDDTGRLWWRWSRDTDFDGLHLPEDPHAAGWTSW